MAAGTIERIQLVLQAVTSGFTKGLGRAQTKLKTVGKNIHNFGQVMQAPMQNFKVLNKSFKTMKTTGGRLAHGIRSLTHGMRGFRMEALGVMFFGMMMQRMFMGLLQPVMEAFGVFDIFRLMLLTLFLPVMELIFPFLMRIMDWFMNLPEPVKKAIGIFVVLGAIFGTIIMVLGQFALGIGSLILFFGWLITPLGLVLAGLAALLGFVLIVALFKKISKGTDGMREKFVSFGLSGEVFDTMKNKIMSWYGVLKDKFLALKDKIGGWVAGVIPFMIAFGGDLLMGLVNGIVNNAGKISKAISHLISKISSWISENISSILKTGLEILKAIIEGISENIDEISGALKEFVEAIGQFFEDNWKDLVKIGGRIALAIIEGIGGTLGDWMRRLDEKIFRGFGDIGLREHNLRVMASKDDFIWRPGQSPISVNPNDTLVGFRGTLPGAGEGGSIVQENNFYGFTMDDLNRELDNRDRRLVDDIRRLVKQ